MAKIVVLGSAYVIPDKTHANTHLALLGRPTLVLIDCSGRVLIRLREAGLDADRVEDVILTHFHPDHVDGVPMLIMELWLRGRKRPLRFHGLRHCLERTENLMKAYEWDSWPGLFPISFHLVDEQEQALVLENADFRITASPVQHFVPTLGLRVADKSTGRVLTYSCDTQPCPAASNLATGADLLIHEAAGAGFGHSSAAQAGAVAREAGARRLVLIHYPVGGNDIAHLVPEAAAAFGGPVTLAEDLMVLEL